MKLEWLDQDLDAGTITVGIVDVEGKVLMQETFPDYYPKEMVDEWGVKKVILLELLMERGNDDETTNLHMGLAQRTY